MVFFKLQLSTVTLFETTADRCNVDAVQGLSNSFNRILDQQPCIDSEEMRLFDRGGRVFTRSFIAEREHASVQDAATFHNSHLDSIPDGILTVTITIGTSIQTYRGNVSSATINVDGTRTITRYELTLTNG